MNEFTKEELMDMHDALYFEGWRPEVKNNPYYSLIQKLQSLIENYCEHKEKEVVSSYNHGIIHQNKCKQCRRIV